MTQTPTQTQTKASILSDLDYVRTLAEEGRNAPLIGGRFGLWWGFLLCGALLFHWLMETGRVGAPGYMFGVLWLGFAVVGVIGGRVLIRSLKGKPGASAVNNRVSRALWTGNSVVLFTFWFAASLSAGLGYNDFSLMNMIMPLAFGLYGLTSYVTAAMSGDKWMYIPGVSGFVFMAALLFMLSSPDLFLVAIVGVIATLIIPGGLQMRREPRAVV